MMKSGLKLKEIRKHEVDSRGMGDVYHEALRRFGEKMNDKGGPPADKKSAWNTSTRAETDAVVDEVFREIEKDGGSRVSEEGALLFAKEDPAAVYRIGRLRSIIKEACFALTDRAAKSGAEEMLFEKEFYVSEDDLGVENLSIAGRIDRIDILPGGRAKVVDYKSGYEKFNINNVRNGWQLQLMLYLKAVELDYEPAGASYFRIFEPSIKLSDPKAPETEAEIAEAILGEYNSDGITTEPMAEDPAAPAGKNKAPGGEKIVTTAEFEELRSVVDDRLSEIAAGLTAGLAPAAPKEKAGGEQVTACTYCAYLSICNYEFT